MRRLDLLEPEDLPVSLGQLTLLSLRGEGSTGRVFRADSRGIGGLPRVVAVLVLQPAGGMPSTEPWGDVLAAVHAARTLRHKGIVQTFSAGERDGLPFAVTELVEGVPLSELVLGLGALPPRSLLDVGIQACSALAAVHGLAASGTVPQLHLDLRPSRIMVSADGVVKVRGFGLAALVDPGGGEGGRGAFAAPEVLGGKRPDPRADQFSLGAALTWAVLGTSPFEAPPAAPAAHQIAAIVRASEGALAARIDKLAHGLGPVLAKMIAPEPSDRYGSVTGAEASLREIRGGLPTGERLSRLVARQSGRDLAELTVPGPAPRPLLEGAAAMPVPAPRDQRRKPPPAPRSTVQPPSDPEDDLGVAPLPPPVEVSLRELVAAPRGHDPFEDEDLATEGGVADSDLESLDVLPAVDDAAREALRSLVELEPTELATVVPRPRSRPVPKPAPPGPSATPLAGLGSSSSLPARAELGDAGLTMSPPAVPPIAAPLPAPPSPGEAATAPHAVPVARTPMPAPPPRPAPPTANLRPAPVGPVPRREVAEGDDEDEASGGALRTLIRVLAVAIIVLGVTFIVLKVMLLQREASPSEVATMVPSEDEQADEPGGGASAADGAKAAASGGSVADEEAGPVAEETPPPERRSRVAEPAPAADPEGTEPLRSTDAPRSTEAPRETVAPRPTEAEEAPVASDLPPGSVVLSMSHRPVTAGDSGASDLVQVRLEGPPDSRVVFYSGPAGGPFGQTPMRARGSGRWETWLKFEGPTGSRMEYWVTASHGAADADASSGSRSAPHVVEIR